MGDNRLSQIGTNNLQGLRAPECGVTGFIVNLFIYCKNTKDPIMSLLDRKRGHKSRIYSIKRIDQNLSPGNGM